MFNTIPEGFVKLKINVIKCARCEEDHMMEFHKFKKNAIDDFTHYGACPITREPVLLKIEHIEVSHITPTTSKKRFIPTADFK